MSDSPPPSSSPPPSRSRALFVTVFLIFLIALISFSRESAFLNFEFAYFDGGADVLPGEEVPHTGVLPPPSSAPSPGKAGGGVEGGKAPSPAPTMKPNEEVKETPNHTPNPTPAPAGEGGGKEKVSVKVAMLTVSANIDQDGKLQYGETKSMVTGPISVDNKARYCIENGWDLVIGGPLGEGEGGKRGGEMHGRSSRWLKIYHLLEIWDDYDIIVWMDLDTLMTTPKVNIVDYFDEDKELHFTDDLGNFDRINSGVFGLKTTPFAKDFFERVWDHNDDDGKGNKQGKSDQKSINAILKSLSDEDKNSKVDIIDRTVFNAFPKVKEAPPTGDGYIRVQGFNWPGGAEDGDETEDTVVIHFAGLFAGCCVGGGDIPSGMLVQYFKRLMDYHAVFLSLIDPSSASFHVYDDGIPSLSAPSALRSGEDIIGRMDVMKGEIGPMVAGGLQTLMVKGDTDKLRDSILLQMNKFIPSPGDKE
ncbi:hypothetical protein TrCOL_g2641 [Triparma columacea]|uniref:Nucleotide-diphospho-sugar transferase domain-containing protein n=1 Tax=Triparma columacea TaxID=722753 RepID=A0A9W7GDR1_9STRA|nr:hypothetical protein TrCOL_g2641 [Triparma columacea]